MYSTKGYENNTSPSSATQEPFLQVSTTDSPSLFPSLAALSPSPKSITSPLKKTWLRWFILAIATIINFALNYSSNNPQALQPSIQSVLGIEDAQFNMLYSVYSLPNIILPLFGGILADVIGVRFAINLFGFLVLIGQGVFTFGAYRENFQLMVLGRFVFGLGGECLTVAQLPLVAKWFKGGELAFAYGFAKSAVRFGKAANSFFTPKIFIWTNSIFTPLFVGSIVSLVSFLSGLVLCYFDKKADKEERSASAQKKKKVSFKDLKTFPRIYYILLASYAVMFAVFTGLSNTLNKVLVTRFGFETDVAGNVVMLYYFVSAIAGPFVGLIVEKYGRLTQMTLFLTITLLFANLGFAVIKDGSQGHPNYQVIYPMVGVTIFSSFYTILFWACVAAVIDKKKIGLGTGMITCMSNFSQTVLPFILGYIHDRTINFHFGYYWTLMALCGLVGVGFILDFWIHCEDKRTGRILSMSKKEEKALGLTSSINRDETEREILASEDIKSFVDA